MQLSRSAISPVAADGGTDILSLVRSVQGLAQSLKVRSLNATQRTLTCLSVPLNRSSVVRSLSFVAVDGREGQVAYFFTAHNICGQFTSVR